ncbi:hypothetical protein D3C79_983230 [compost metagenome]
MRTVSIGENSTLPQWSGEMKTPFTSMLMGGAERGAYPDTLRCSHPSIVITLSVLWRSRGEPSSLLG